MLARKLYKNGDWGLGPEMGILEKLRGWCLIGGNPHRPIPICFFLI